MLLSYFVLLQITISAFISSVLITIESVCTLTIIKILNRLRFLSIFSMSLDNLLLMKRATLNYA